VSFGLLGSAFLLATVSALHCMGMCGAFALVARSGPAWHLGKILSYMALGAAAGALGHAVSTASVGPALTVGVAVVASIVLVISSLQLAGRLPHKLGASKVGSWLARPLRDLAAAEGMGLHGRRLLFGLANGLVPCGVVYAGLALAAVSGGVVNGALVMLAFGLGTVPALVGVVLGARSIGALGRRPWVRQTAAALALVVGLTSVWWRTPLRAAESPEDAAPTCHEVPE
jgi:uncharacterized protein